MPARPWRYREVGTKDPVTDVPLLGRSASRWTKKDLDFLGVVYQYDQFDSIAIMVDDNDITPGLRNGSSILCLVINDLIYSHRNVCRENHLC